MKKIFINGFEYQYNTSNSKLFLDGSKVEQRYLTPNEKEQLNTWVNYNGTPMYSF